MIRMWRLCDETFDASVVLWRPKLHLLSKRTLYSQKYYWHKSYQQIRKKIRNILTFICYNLNIYEWAIWIYDAVNEASGATAFNVENLENWRGITMQFLYSMPVFLSFWTDCQKFLAVVENLTKLMSHESLSLVKAVWHFCWIYCTQQ